MRSFDDKHPIMFHVALGIVGLSHNFSVVLSFAIRDLNLICSAQTHTCVSARERLICENEIEKFQFHENTRSDCVCVCVYTAQPQPRSRMDKNRAHTHMVDYRFARFKT